MRLRTFSLCLALPWLAPPAWPWGAEGHRLVAEITWLHLSETAKASITGILPEGMTLASIASWADEVRPQRRETAPWHYINIPLDAPQGSWRPYCHDDECIITAIQRMAARVADPRLAAAERDEALRFVVHLVGDLHQPLHCGDRRDRGGNDVPVIFRRRPTNLHSIWDTALLREMLQGEGTRDRLLRKAPPEEWERESAGGPEQWVWDSHRFSRDVAYAALPPGRPALLDDEYAERAYLVIEAQIRRAGLRLAALLERTLAETGSPEAR